MNLIYAYAILAAAVFCSYKLAKEKQQHHIIWPIITVVLGPVVFIIQYLVTVVSKKRVIG